MRWQDKPRHRGGFVRHASRPHDERNFLDRLGHSRRRGHREDRISAGDEHRIDLAAAHRVNRRVHFIRRAGLFGRRAFEEHHGLAEIAGDRVEDHRRKMSRRIVRARDCQRAVGPAERLAEPGNGFHRHAGPRARGSRIEIRDRLAERREIEARVLRNPALLDENVEHAPRNIGLRTRSSRDPVVALRRRHAEPRAEVGGAANGKRAAPLMWRAEQRVLTREFHRRLPGLKKVRTEGNQHFGLIDSIRRQIAPPKDRFRRNPRRFLVDGLVKYRARRAISAEKRERDFSEGRALRRTEERHAVLARLRRRRQPVAEHFVRLVPRNGPDRAVVATNLRMRKAIGIVQTLQRRLSPGAQRTLANGIGRISLQLDDAPFPDSRHHTASRRALRTRRGKKTRHAGNYVLVGHHVRDQLPRRRLAARDRRRRTRSCGQLDE